jgi:1-acyl-sn-glycerol-3-phosphate acyltransferase
LLFTEGDTALRTLYTILWFIVFTIRGFSALPKIFYLKLVRNKITPEERIKSAHRTMKRWAWGNIRQARVKMVVRGQENIPARNVVFIGNHQSWFDIVAMFACAPPTGFVAKKETMKVPILKQYILLLGGVFIDRDNLRQAAKAIKEATDLIRDGHTMCIYPEGTRSKSNTMLEWKAGSFKLATRHQTPIVPITIHNSYKILEGNNYRVKGATVTMVFHEPIYLEGMSKDEQKELPQRVEGIIRAQLEELERESSSINEK